MMSRLLLALVLALPASLAVSLAAQLSPAFAAPAEIRVTLGASEPVGSVNVRQFGFNLYRAELWTRDAKAFSWGRPFALTLHYNRSFSAELLVDSSIAEMARLSGRPEAAFGGLAGKLRRCFADVAAGDTITGFSRSASAASFFVNGRKSCDVNHAGFSRDFFGIWLKPAARNPQLARMLQGNS